jgi:hypothetical protein
MGKAAENEKIKFKATFENNAAVACLAGGAFLPLFAVYGHIPEFAIPAANGQWGELYVKVLFTLLPVLAAWWAGWRLHRRAIAMLDKIED